MLDEVHQFMMEGKLVPHELVMSIMRERMSKPDILTRGCLLDNFPLTAGQASTLVGNMRVDQVLLVKVPDEELRLRSLERRIDPLTGRIYHLTFRPPPSDQPQVAQRLVQRSDDQEELVSKRLETYKRHIETILPFFKDKVVSVDGTNSPAEVLAEACQAMDQLEWTTSDLPYFGNVAFAGPFSIQQARRAGFYSPDNPPEVGDQVVCFQRGANWQRRGQVEDISETVSEGSGLRKGHEGMLVTLSTGTGSFTCWSAFLAPVNDKEYSSLCTTHGLLSSHFASLYPCSKGVGDVEFVSKEAARWSLEKWLSNLEDADGEPFEIDASKLQSLLELFDSHQDASLYLYTTHQKLGQRVTLNTGQDYSLYYRALNNTLNCDARSNLENAMPLIQRMVYLLLYDEENGSKRIHEGGRVWKGDTQRPVPLNMQKLREAMRLDRFVRFRQFQSTTREKTLAEKYRAREDGKGYLWTIDIPPGFWGARDIQDPYPLMCEVTKCFSRSFPHLRCGVVRCC